MRTLYDFLIDEIFIGFLKQSSTLMDEITAFKGDVQIIDHHLVFTLPALFELTCQLFEKDHPSELSRRRSDYLQFRKQLYSNPTNTLLQKEGGMVEIEKPEKGHDDSIYKLICISTNNGTSDL